jgi:hypothetical protein
MTATDGSLVNNPRWLALPKESRDKLLEKHRYDEVQHHGWWECVYEDFVEGMWEIGIHVNNMTFSGFCSQGDGAAFEGHVDQWSKVMREIGLLMKYEFFAGNGLRFHARPPHNNCMRFSMDADPKVCPYDEDDDPIRFDLWQLTHPSAKDFDDLEDKLKELFENKASQLYRNLEAEHDYLTSDEYVIERLLDDDDEIKEIEDYLLSCEEHC